MEKFILNNTSLKFKENGKLDLPKNKKHVKIDIGLSYNAPQSKLWLSKENDLLVFGFEPHPQSVNSILNTQFFKNYTDQFFIIPCALGLTNTNLNLYSTTDDIGCSSVFEPIYLKTNNLFEVPCFTLKSFFDIFPFEDYPLIEYIKVDAQGSDLNIVKSGCEYIKNHVAIITLEAENYHYKNTYNSEDEINNYMESIDFEKISTTTATDPTFVNKKFKNLEIYYEQYY